MFYRYPNMLYKLYNKIKFTFAQIALFEISV